MAVPAGTARATKDSVVLCAQVRVAAAERIVETLSALPPAILDQVSAGLRLILDRCAGALQPGSGSVSFLTMLERSGNNLATSAEHNAVAMPDYRPLKSYDEAAHADRIRKLLAKRIDSLPLGALVKLQEVAALLEAGDRIAFLARERHGKRRGKTQVQRREDVDRGFRDEAAHSGVKANHEVAERTTVSEALHRRRARMRRHATNPADTLSTDPCPSQRLRKAQGANPRPGEPRNPMNARPRFNEQKATQVAARFLKAAGRRLPYMSVLKLMYFADREALLRWGAPITNDAYYSLDHGPILSRVKDLIVEEHRDAGFWAQHISAPEKYVIELIREAGDDQLSRAEERLIDEIYGKHRGKDQWQLSKESHDLPEWEDPHGTSIPIDIEDILDAGGVPRKEREAIAAELKGWRRMQALSAE